MFSLASTLSPNYLFIPEAIVVSLNLLKVIRIMSWRLNIWLGWFWNDKFSQTSSIFWNILTEDTISQLNLVHFIRVIDFCRKQVRFFSDVVLRIMSNVTHKYLDLLLGPNSGCFFFLGLDNSQIITCGSGVDIVVNSTKIPEILVVFYCVTLCDVMMISL